ncbi:MAG TPA: hypothetical protein VH088_12655, partial [Terriglobales bacterium]|nr:hypothetical protein [Terriglobales bacterium]
MKISSGLSFAILILLSFTPQSHASGVSLQVTGDKIHGYSTTIVFKGQAITSNPGEFTASFQNGSRELSARIENWKATAWTGDAHHATLTGEAYLDALKTNVEISLDYEVMSSNVVRKKISLKQTDAHLLYYQIKNELRPTESPAKFWSFDQPDCKGGPLHEYFPAAGFRTKDGVTVGLLTDAGYRNLWNRTIRRDNAESVKPAPNEISDVNLEYVNRTDNSVNQTFGEELVVDPLPAKPVELPSVSSWHKKGVLNAGTADNIRLNVHQRDDGISIPLPLTGGEIYSLSFECRARRDFAARFLDVDGEFHMAKDLTLFNDRVPKSPAGWTKFETTVYIPALQAKTAALFLGNSGDFAENASETIEIKGLQVQRLETRLQPYHRLEMDHSETKTSFIFADQEVPDTIRGYRLASEVHLADGLGFRGTDPEKVLYADVMMLSWTAEPHVARPLLVPSIFYGAAGEMYLRDSFYTAQGLNNRELNESIFD